MLGVEAGGTEGATERVLVTGASGFIGRELVRELRSRGYAVRAAGRLAGDAEVPGIEPFRIDDWRARIDWGAAVADCTSVVHLAGRAHVLNESSSDPLAEFRAGNVAITQALGRAARDAGVRRFVFVSSIGVYGSNGDHAIRASDRPHPREPYAVSKLEAEEKLRAIAAGSPMEIVVVRPPLVFGPHAKGNVERLLWLCSLGLPLPFGALEGTRSIVNVWNLCDLLAVALQHPAAAGDPLLVSDAEDVTLPQLLRTIAAELHRPARLVRVPPGLLRAACTLVGQRAALEKIGAGIRVDISETRRRLDWTPPTDVRDGLIRTARWYREEIMSRKGVDA